MLVYFLSCCFFVVGLSCIYYSFFRWLLPGNLFWVKTSALPRVSNLKIIGDVREGSKLSVSANVSGGTEGSSRVQWFKSSSSNLEDKTSLEALSTSKIAKVLSAPHFLHFLHRLSSVGMWRVQTDFGSVLFCYCICLVNFLAKQGFFFEISIYG